MNFWSVSESLWLVWALRCKAHHNWERHVGGRRLPQLQTGEYFFLDRSIDSWVARRAGQLNACDPAGRVRVILASANYNVIVPFLRGFGPTRFLSASTPRSGQQAALAHDLLALMDALNISRGVLAGYDWGGRAACIVAALWLARVKGLVSQGGYNIQNISRSQEPKAPEIEYRAWYEYYFLTERGRKGLEIYRREFCQLL